MGNLEKLMKLEENLKILEEIRNDIENKRLVDKRIEWEIRYGLFESTLIVIDVACKLTAKYNLAKPKNYRECIEALIKKDIVDEEIGEHLIKMVGFRNILMHEYEDIQVGRMIEYLSKLEDFKKFIENVREL